jgi:CDP-diacylglycerol--glycerol-3-phosphate 3-phosphatidyltransferase
MTPNPHANPLPNILTGIRLFAGVIMFLMLAGAAPGALEDSLLSPSLQSSFSLWAFWIFVVAASTDWIDG